MNVRQFIAEFRERTDDTLPAYLWSDAEVLGYLNDAVNEACERALLIEDHTTASCCRITLVADTDTYALHPSVIEVKRVARQGDPMAPSSVEQEDDADTRWETRTGQPRRFIAGDSTLRVVPAPDALHAGQVLTVTVYRRPIEARSLVAPNDTAPEVPERFHQRLLDWMLFRGYSKPDAETINKVAAAQHEALFERSFGPRVSANVQRKRRDRRPPVVRMHW